MKTAQLSTKTVATAHKCGGTKTMVDTGGVYGEAVIFNISWQETGKKKSRGGEANQEVTPRPRSPCQKRRP